VVAGLAEAAEASGVLVEVPRVGVELAEAGSNQHSAARWPQQEGDSLCSPSLQNLNTESTEGLGDLRVESFL